MASDVIPTTPQAAPIGVLCVDDNPLVAAALARKLDAADGIRWLGHLENAERLTDTALEKRPNVILLDVDMPGREPLSVIRELAERGSEARVIIFSGYVHWKLFERAVTEGAWGYISKSDGEDAVLAGIRQVARGEFAVSAEVRDKIDRPDA